MSVSKKDQVRQNLLDSTPDGNGETPGNTPSVIRATKEEWLESREKKIMAELED